MTAGRTYDTIAARLHELRLTAGNPSYTDIVGRVADVRNRRGVPAAQQRPARATVYDCFKSDRRRFDIELVTDIAAALGLADAALTEFESLCWTVQHGLDTARIVNVRTSLPEPSHPMVGRAEELARLTASPVGPVVVEGMAGVGKTTLVSEAARRLIARGDAGSVVFADLRGFTLDRPPADTDALIDAIVRSLGGTALASRGMDARRRQYSQMLVDQRVLLVLDDAAGAAQVAPLLPDDPAVGVLITSRHTIAAELGATAVRLDVLPADDAAEMLRIAAGDTVDSWTTEQLVDLAGIVGHLPLALGVTASRIGARPGWTFADHARSLVASHGEARLDDAVRTVLDESHAALDPATARILRMLASVPFDDLGLASVTAMCGGDDEAASAAVARLTSASLIGRQARDRVAMHALVRAHARERSLDADRPTDRDEALLALVDHLVATSRAAAEAAAARRGDPPRYAVAATATEFDAAGALAWVDTEFENLLVASDEQGTALRPSAAIDLSESLGWYIERRARYGEALILDDRAVAAARSLGDDVGEGLAEVGRGQWHTRLGQMAEAITSIRRAEVLLAGHEHGLARAKNALAVWAFQAGEWDTSISALLEATDIYRRVGGPADMARCHGNLAVIYTRVGQLDRAVEHQEQAAALAMSTGDMDTAAFTWTNSSGTQLQRGDYAAALAAAERAVEISEANGVTAILALALNNLGTALVQLGRVDDGIAQLRRAQQEARAAGNRVDELATLVQLGEAYLMAGRLDEADAELATAREWAIEQDDDFQQGRVLELVGRVSLERGDAERARSDWTTALGLLDESLPDAQRLRDLLGTLRDEVAR